MLAQLPRLRGVKLGIQAYEGTEEDYNYPNDAGYEWVEPPAMAGLAALTELALVGGTSLPPDWRQLSGLQRLRVTVGAGEGDADAFDWGSAPLTALTALTHLEVRGLMPGEGRRLQLQGVWACCHGGWLQSHRLLELPVAKLSPPLPPAIPCCRPCHAGHCPQPGRGGDQQLRCQLGR